MKPQLRRDLVRSRLRLGVFAVLDGTDVWRRAALGVALEVFSGQRLAASQIDCWAVCSWVEHIDEPEIVDGDHTPSASVQGPLTKALRGAGRSSATPSASAAGATVSGSRP